MKFWSRLFRRRKRKNEELTEETDGAVYGLAEHEVDLEDEQQRTGYVESLLTQIADAQKQISECESEYAMVDLYLKDMELIDYISGEDREKLTECAKAVHLLEADKSRYEKKKKHMSDTDYAKMERLSEDAHDSLARLQEAEQTGKRKAGMSVQKAGSKDSNGKSAWHGDHHHSSGLFLYRDPADHAVCL